MSLNDRKEISNNKFLGNLSHIPFKIINDYKQPMESILTRNTPNPKFNPKRRMEL